MKNDAYKVYPKGWSHLAVEVVASSPEAAKELAAHQMKAADGLELEAVKL